MNDKNVLWFIKGVYSAGLRVEEIRKRAIAEFGQYHTETIDRAITLVAEKIDAKKMADGRSYGDGSVQNTGHVPAAVFFRYDLRSRSRRGTG